MGRVAILMIIAFLIPFVLYRAFLSLFRMDKDGVNWLAAPLGVLAFFGAVFSIGMIVFLTLLSEGAIKIEWLGE